MYLVVRGEVEVLDDTGARARRRFRDGDFFGEIAPADPHAAHRHRPGQDGLRPAWRWTRPAFDRILHDYPQFADSVLQVANERYNLNLQTGTLLSSPAPR